MLSIDCLAFDLAKLKGFGIKDEFFAFKSENIDKIVEFLVAGRKDLIVGLFGSRFIKEMGENSGNFHVLREPLAKDEER